MAIGFRLPTTATPAGIKAISKAHRKVWRTEPSFGITQINYSYKALAAYTWLRTDRGPQRSWLHKIGKADTPNCPRCQYHTDSGQHITFECPTWDTLRQSLIGQRKQWADLDQAIWIKQGPDTKDIFDGGEEWFSHLFTFLS